jgi:hypothetical protein
MSSQRTPHTLPMPKEVRLCVIYFERSAKLLLERPPPKTTWHRIVSFSEYSNRQLMNLKKGQLVYVEAGFDIREPEAEADPSTPQGQRQIFLTHSKSCLLGIMTFRIASQI